MAWRDLITSISEADMLQKGWRGLLFSTLCCLNAWGKKGSWWDLCLWPASSGAESPGYFLAKQVGCLYQTGQVSLGNVAYVRWAMILQCLHCMQRVDQQPSSMLAAYSPSLAWNESIFFGKMWWLWRTKVKQQWCWWGMTSTSLSLMRALSYQTWLMWRRLQTWRGIGTERRTAHQDFGNFENCTFIWSANHD